MSQVEQDLVALFATSDFAREFVPEDPAKPAFRAIFGVVDEGDVLDGHATHADRKIHYVTSSAHLRADDVLVDSGGDGVASGTRWRLLDNPMRVNDGLESVAYLSAVRP